MATALTFTTLKERVNRAIERSSAAADPDFAAELPCLINDAERQIATELKVLLFLRVVTASFTASQAVYQKPLGWRETVSFNFGGGDAQETRTQLLPRSYEFLTTYWPDRTATGTPEIYADYEQNYWIVAPTPLAARPYEVLFYEQPTLLDDTNQVNKITERAPELLYFGTLLQTAPFLKDDPRIQVWGSRYDRWLAALKGQDTDLQADRTADRRTRA